MRSKGSSRFKVGDVVSTAGIILKITGHSNFYKDSLEQDAYTILGISKDLEDVQTVPIYHADENFQLCGKNFQLLYGD